ncbi:uncharacterized protein LOC114966748 [Acropora millepora]|uniref:uncharacterized protein LOC114966748 n=1 Tax=Acropora millepora TaxID=45264 RepID=UPI001CF5816A|nr:uncharacterized protein LOC114966748 [Acropora millepora]
MSRKRTIFVMLIVAFATLWVSCLAEEDDKWLPVFKEDFSRMKPSLSDVILQPNRLRAKRALRRFKRWWWCEDSSLPGCPKQKNRISHDQKIQTTNKKSRK